MRIQLAVCSALLCATAAVADFRYRNVSETKWGFADRAIGVGNCTIEDFENITLSPNADFDQYFWSSNQNPIACNNCKSINKIF